MSLNDTTKTDRLFKGSQDRRMTSADKAYYEEETSNLKVILGNEVWLDDINSTPSNAISDGVAWMQSGWMHEDTTVANENSWFASGNNNSSGDWKRWIPPKCGQGYTIKIYQSGSGDGNLGSKITDANLGLYGGVFDYQEGVLWWQDTHSYTTPFYISGYRYSGSLTTKSKLDELYQASGAGSDTSWSGATGYIGHSSNTDIHYASSNLLNWLDGEYQQSGTQGGISSWYDLSAGTGVTPFGGSVSVSGTQAETVSVLGYSNISSNAKKGQASGAIALYSETYSSEGDLTSALNDNYPGSSNVNRTLIDTISGNLDDKIDAISDTPSTWGTLTAGTGIDTLSNVGVSGSGETVTVLGYLNISGNAHDAHVSTQAMGDLAFKDSIDIGDDTNLTAGTGIGVSDDTVSVLGYLNISGNAKDVKNWYDASSSRISEFIGSGTEYSTAYDERGSQIDGTGLLWDGSELDVQGYLEISGNAHDVKAWYDASGEKLSTISGSLVAKIKSNLADLDDVAGMSGKSDNDALTWDTTQNKWSSQAVSTSDVAWSGASDFYGFSSNAINLFGASSHTHDGRYYTETESIDLFADSSATQTKLNAKQDTLTGSEYYPSSSGKINFTDLFNTSSNFDLRLDSLEAYSSNLWTERTGGIYYGNEVILGHSTFDLGNYQFQVSGDTYLSGTTTFKGSTISGLATPTFPSAAANKKYVDDKNLPLSGLTDVVDGFNSDSFHDSGLKWNKATGKWVVTQVAGGGGAVDNYTVKVDSAATADFVGAANSDGVLRADSTMTYADGGDYVTIGVDESSILTTVSSNAKTSYDWYTASAQKLSASGALAHNRVTLAGESYITISDQEITAAKLDLSETNATDGLGITFTTNDISVTDYIASSTAVDKFLISSDFSTWRSSVDSTEMGYLDGVNSDIQTQLDNKDNLGDITWNTPTQASGVTLVGTAGISGNLKVTLSDIPQNVIKSGSNWQKAYISTSTGIFANASHIHDNRYYTESESVANFVESGGTKWIDLTDGGETILHTHAGMTTDVSWSGASEFYGFSSNAINLFGASSHTHDSRYYTETESIALFADSSAIQTKLNNKQDTLTGSEYYPSSLGHSNYLEYTGHSGNTTVHYTKASINLNDLSDTSVPAPTSGNSLMWNGSAWIDSTVSGQSGVSATANYNAGWEIVSSQSKITHNFGTTPTMVGISPSGTDTFGYSVSYDHQYITVYLSVEGKHCVNWFAGGPNSGEELDFYLYPQNVEVIRDGNNRIHFSGQNGTYVYSGNNTIIISSSTAGGGGGGGAVNWNYINDGYGITSWSNDAYRVSSSAGDLTISVDMSNFVESSTALDRFAHSTNINSRFYGSGSTIHSNYLMSSAKYTTVADTDNDGYLSTTDWDTFNNKQSTLSAGDHSTDWESAHDWYVASSSKLSASSQTALYEETYSNESDLTSVLDDNYPGSSNVNLTYIDTISGNLNTKIDNKQDTLNGSEYYPSSLGKSNYLHSSNSLIHLTGISSPLSGQIPTYGANLSNITWQNVLPPITVSKANMRISGQQYIELSSFKCPVGTKAYIWQAYACNSSQTSVGHLKVEMLSGSTSVYSTSSATLQQGYPLAYSDGGSTTIRFAYSSNSGTVSGIEYGTCLMQYSVY